MAASGEAERATNSTATNDRRQCVARKTSHSSWSRVKDLRSVDNSLGVADKSQTGKDGLELRAFIEEKKIR